VPTTNSLHTLFGERSMWDLSRLDGLPISGRIYDEIILSAQVFNH